MSRPAMLVCRGIATGAVLCYIYCDDILNWMMAEAEHTSNIRNSTKQKHEDGQARKKRMEECREG